MFVYTLEWKLTFFSFGPRGCLALTSSRPLSRACLCSGRVRLIFLHGVRGTYPLCFVFYFFIYSTYILVPSMYWPFDLFVPLVFLRFFLQEGEHKTNTLLHAFTPIVLRTVFIECLRELVWSLILLLFLSLTEPFPDPSAALNLLNPAERRVRHQLDVHLYVPGRALPRGDALRHLRHGAAVHLLHDQEVRAHHLHDHHDHQADGVPRRLRCSVSGPMLPLALVTVGYGCRRLWLPLVVVAVGCVL